MFNPAAAIKVVKEELTKNPQLVHEWNAKAEKDPAGVRADILKQAEAKGVKMSEGQLKTLLKMAKPMLGKLNDTIREAATQLIQRIS